MTKPRPQGGARALGAPVRLLFVLVLALAATLSFAQPLSPAAQSYLDRARTALEANPRLAYMPNMLLVKFRAGAPEASRAEVRGALRSTLIRRFGLVPGLEHHGVPGSVELAAKLLRTHPDVEYAEPDYILHADVVPNDPNFGLLWGLHNTGQSGGTADMDIDAPEAWDTTTGGSGFIVAVIDTGIDYNHPDLAANSWINANEVAGNGLDDDGNGFIDDVRGWDFYNNDSNPMDDNNHGTHCAGTIGAVGNNGSGVVGVNWQCKLMALKFLGSGGSGPTSAAVSCLNYAVMMGARVSNNSWGGGSFSTSLFNAIEAAKASNHVFCAAAGNSSVNTDASPHYPSSYSSDNIISVASIDRLGNRSSFSNYGATSVDLAAPGSSITSTIRNGSYGTMSGTSMATPHVAGVAALVAAQNPGWTYTQVRNRVLSTVVPIASMAGITVTGGLLNAANAVGAPPANTPPVVTITSPSNGAAFLQGTGITFSGSANDAEQGNLSLNLVWTSSLMGQIGAGASFSRSDLVVGTHTITASATDAGNLTGSSSITITIQAPSTIPNPPSNLTATRSSSGVGLIRYSDNSPNETGFHLERQRRSGSSWGSTTTITLAANVTQHSDPAGTGHFRYRVRAFNGSGASAWTDWVTVKL